MAVTTKFYINPFSINGDVTPIPDDAQVDGSISYDEGWPFDYQRNRLTDPLAKVITRNSMNELFYQITTNIKQYQEFGFPNFITSADNGGSPFEYEENVIVYQPSDGKFYRSTVSANTQVPPDTNWQEYTGGSVTIPDGNYGDITVSGGGAVWTINANAVTTTKINALAVTTAKIAANAVTNAKLAQIATQTIKGRTTAGTGDVEDLTAAQVRTLLGVESLTGRNILAWVNFNGTGTPSIRDSYNVSSITDLGTGNYTINFTSSVSNANYGVFGFCSDGGLGVAMNIDNTVPPTTSAVTVKNKSDDGGGYDPAYVSIFIIGD